jgi:2,4-dienoyl-CoA reductase-like NADH-dependent reductase (Old Yellow Enzyme family)
MNLFSPFTLKNIPLKNRLIRSATAERIAFNNKTEYEQLLDFYNNLVAGEIGAIITGHIAVHPSGRLYQAMPTLFSTYHIECWQKIVSNLHQSGGILIAQLNHGGGRCPPEVDPFCVSHTSINNREKMEGKELTEAEIALLINSFVVMATQAKKLGFDGVQIHSAHGYLISQFISPLTNKRKDKWGGSLENRAAFLINIIKGIRKASSNEMLLGIKLGACDDAPEGLKLEETLQLATILEKEGVDFIEISGGFKSDLIKRKVSSGKNEGYYREMAKEFKKKLNIPISVVGGFRSIDFINQTLNAGYTDLISMSRPLICEPGLPLLFKQGKITASKCTGCNRCLFTKEGITHCHINKHLNQA